MAQREKRNCVHVITRNGWIFITSVSARVLRAPTTSHSLHYSDGFGVRKLVWCVIFTGFFFFFFCSFLFSSITYFVCVRAGIPVAAVKRRKPVFTRVYYFIYRRRRRRSGMTCFSVRVTRQQSAAQCSGRLNYRNV